MSTSSRLAEQKPDQPEVRPFLYAEAGPGKSAPIAQEHSSANFASGRESELSLQAAREAGRKEAEERMQTYFQKQLEDMRVEIRTALDQFAAEHKRYYQKVEGEVVKLALGIARKILHRESQIDPMVLAGIVRFALDQMENSTNVSLQVAPQKVDEWREYFSRYRGSGVLPTITEDASLREGACTLRTELGTTEFNIAAQLNEIEKGFADLLAQRPE